MNINLDTCGICEYVVNEVDEKLKDPEIVVALDLGGEELCRLLPNAALHEVGHEWYMKIMKLKC